MKVPQAASTLICCAGLLALPLPVAADVSSDGESFDMFRCAMDDGLKFGTTRSHDPQRCSKLAALDAAWRLVAIHGSGRLAFYVDMSSPRRDGAVVSFRQMITVPDSSAASYSGPESVREFDQYTDREADCEAGTIRSTRITLVRNVRTRPELVREFTSAQRPFKLPPSADSTDQKLIDIICKIR